VKAVLGSGASVISSSAGFYIDDTLPEFDPEVHFYIDVYQGPATPVEYQGSNNTIKAVWLCADESQITVSTRNPILHKLIYYCIKYSTRSRLGEAYNQYETILFSTLNMY
jgi:hypothetical protein